LSKLTAKSEIIILKLTFQISTPQIGDIALITPLFLQEKRDSQIRRGLSQKT